MAMTKLASRMTCPSCRTGNSEGSPYCSSCGAALDGVRPEITNPASQSDALRGFLEDGQDPALVKQIVERAAQILITGEEIEYISIANKTMVGVVPACVVATNKRLMDYKRKMLGKIDLDYCSWRDVREIRMLDERHGVSLVVQMIQGWKLTAEALPRVQAWKLYEVGARHNTKLRADLDQLMEDTRSVEQASSDDSILIPEPEHEPAHGSQGLHAHHGQIATFQTTNASTAGLLPLITLPPVEQEAARDWYLQPSLYNEPPLSSPNMPSPNMPSPAPSRTGLDDLFSPFVETKPSLLTISPDEPNLNTLIFEEQHSYPSNPPGYQTFPQDAPVALSSESPASDEDNSGLGGRERDGAIEAVKAEPAPNARQRTQKAARALAADKSPLAVVSPYNAAHNEPRTPSTPHHRPMQKLKQLKRLLDSGLIGEDDYASKKIEILSRF